MFIDKKLPENAFMFKNARHEPMTEPVFIAVSASTKEMVDEHNFSFHLYPINMNSHKKEDSSKETYQLFESKEERFYYSLKDTQFYLREYVLRRFAYLWLILDQLPVGSWGKSIPQWMKNIWKNCPKIFPNELMEEEGGFETTILNMDILCKIHGAREFHDHFQESIRYLQKRQSPSGEFGPLGFAREGMAIQGHARHTALATWFIGEDLLRSDIHRHNLMEMFSNGAKALFLGNREQILRKLSNDRNPVLLYMTCWHIIQMIKDTSFSSTLTDEEKNEIIEIWHRIGEPDNIFFRAVLNDEYITIPESLSEDPRIVWPLTIPYGNFARMELYSFVSALQLLHKNMPDQIKDRFKGGLEDIIEKYLENPTGEYNDPEFLQTKVDRIKRYYKDPLRIKSRGIVPYHAKLKNDIVYPDLGVSSMLLRFLRNREKLSIFWPDEIPEYIHKVRYFLNEDLVELFDSYLRNPNIYALTNAGMMSNFLIGDDRIRLLEIIKPVLNHVRNNFPRELNEHTLEKIISEEKIDTIILDEVIGSNNGRRGNKKIQVSAFSLSRLLLDYIRPGRYVKENLSDKGKLKIASKTLKVYENRAFVQKFISTWEDKAGTEILIPFKAMLKPNTSILDVGCGGGQYALDFMRSGYEVCLLEGSSELLSFSKERIERQMNTSIEGFRCNLLSHQDRENFVRTVNRKFGAIWCSGTFAHIPKGAWIEILKFFYELLEDSGILFVNIMIDNPRIFAHGGRFFTYIRRPDEFISTLEGCRFVIEQTLSSYLTTNTYNEPLLRTNWINFYSIKKPEIPIEQTEKSISEDNEAEFASMLTAHAYQRTVPSFVKVHSENPTRFRYVKATIDTMSKYLGRNQNPVVLDAGCGPGDHIREMARRGWKAFGIDISSDMIEYCISQNKHAQLADVIDVRVGDIARLPKEWNGMFDAIISITVFQHLRDIKAIKVLKEFSRVLKVGGIIRIDIQLNRERGYDPDMRFIEGYLDIDEAINRLNLIPRGTNHIEEDQIFKILKSHTWDLPKGRNTFKRPVRFNFVEFWLKKIK